MHDAKQTPRPETAWTQRICARWLRLVVAACFVLALVASVAGRLVLVKPVFDLDRFVVAPDATTLIAGASHSATAFDPAYFEHAVSVGRNAEPVFFTYHKLRTILERNAGIERVLMAVAASHVSPSQDGLLFAGDAKTRTLHMAYYPFVDAPGRARLGWTEDRLVAGAKFDLWLPLGTMDDLRLIVGYYRGDTNLASFEGWGGFYRVPFEHHLEPEVVADKLAFYFLNEGGEVGDTSALAIEHVEKIVELCAARGVELTFVSTPLYPRFREGIPAQHARAFEELIARLLSEHPELRYFDYSERYSADEFFYDGDHLSRAGTEAFAREFAPVFAGD